MLDERAPNSCLGEVVLSVKVHKLPTDSLQLWKRDWVRRQFDSVFLDIQFSAALARVVFLPLQYRVHYFLRRLIQLVQIV